MRIICFGDSLTACGGDGGRYSDILAERFPAHEFLNRGINGGTLAEARKRLKGDVLLEKPDVVLIEFGANDWWRDERPLTAWVEDLEYIVARVREIRAFPIILGVFGPLRDADGHETPKTEGTDARAEVFRRLEAAIAARHACPYLPNIQARIVGDRRCWADANHPNEYGNRYVADEIAGVIADAGGTPALPIRLPNLETTRDLWMEAVAHAPHAVAAVDGPLRLTYGEAHMAVMHLADGLFAAAGPRPRVAAYLPNCLEYFLLYWAVQRLGGVIIPLNTWLKPESLSAILRSVEPDILVVKSADDEPMASVDAIVPRRTVAGLLGDAPPHPPAPLAPDDLSIILHTSGTTGAPKGAMMRHADILFNVTATINAQRFVPGDVHLLINPMFHATALYSLLPVAAYQKSTLVITADTDPDALLALVARENVTTFLSIPTIFRTLLRTAAVPAATVPALRLMAYAGSPMPVATIAALRARFPGVALHNFFGLTETICPTHVLRDDETEQHPDSIGRLLPFVEARVVAEDGRELPPGGVGELLFARDVVIPGYWGPAANTGTGYLLPGEPNPTTSSSAIDNLSLYLLELDGRQWFRTGDLAAVDEEGYFYLKGRKKDMIIVGGENVYAAEVEAVLQQHPLVEEAAVIGVPATGVRAPLGELVKAYVVARDPALTERDLKGHCYARLPSYKVPALIVFLPRLPRNPGGKVMKGDLS